MVSKKLLGQKGWLDFIVDYNFFKIYKSRMNWMICVIG